MFLETDAPVRFPILLRNRLDNRFCHIINHFICHAWVDTDPEGIIQDKLCCFQTAGDAVGVCIAELIETRVFNDIAAEQETGLNLMIFDITRHIISIQAAFRLNADQEAEPGGLAVCSRLGQDQLILIRLQCRMETFPVMSTCFNKGGELFELLAADSSLHIRHLQVISKVAVHIFVVIALRKLTKLTVKTMTAEVIMTGRANAVAAPIAIRKNQTVEQRIVCIHATTLAHGHVVRRIEAAGADIAPSAGITGLSHR